MQRKLALGLTMNFVFSAMAAFAEEPAPKSATEKAAESARRENVEILRAQPRVVADLLARRVALVDWNETPFEEILNWLHDLTEADVNIVAKWGPLGVEGVTPDKAVTLKIRNATVAEILLEVQEQLSDSGELRFVAIDNTLKFTTKQDLDKYLYMRVYDATDVLARVPNFGQGAPGIDLQRTRSSGGGGGGGGGGQSVFSGGQGGGSEEDESGEQAEQKLEEKLNKLKASIQNLIEPESWRTPQGGGRGTIEVFGSSLIVKNTIEVHEQIAGHFSYQD